MSPQSFARFFPISRMDEFIDLGYPDEQLLLSEVTLHGQAQGWSQQQIDEQYQSLWDEIKEYCEQLEDEALDSNF
ncbi:MAG: hypothetical protein JXM73_13845 [Anaerolineae bacterium]|nr:hypothetical protein [Anaerolineae bacterium]